jgi:biopolymer transport protein ExbD
VLAAVLEDKVRGDDPVGLTLDVSIPYARLGYLINALQKAGFRNLALLTNGGKQMVPLELGDSAAVNKSGLRMVVTLRGDRLTVWSLSGEEGTQQAPKLAARWEGTRTLPALTAALAEIARRRWPDGARLAADRTIMIQLDRNADVQTLLNVLAAVRMDGTLELFPNIFLAGGV